MGKTGNKEQQPTKYTKLILLGNGFDLAHGLKTSYNHFIDFIEDNMGHFSKGLNNEDYRFSVSEKSTKMNEEELIYLVNKNHEHKIDKYIALYAQNKTDNQEAFKYLISNPYHKSIYYKTLFNQRKQAKYNKDKDFENWADLEQLYFDLLYEHRNNAKDIDTINEEFEHITDLLQDYLTNEVEGKILCLNKHIHKPYKNNYTGVPFVNKHKNISIFTKNKYIDDLFNAKRPNKSNILFEETYVISFNYTSNLLEHLYCKNANKNLSTKPIYLHGKLNDKENPIIFGYGDESTNKYKELQELKETKQLKDDAVFQNFKTFRYLRTGNFGAVMGLLGLSSNIYVQIIGHSFGLCDKTILQSVFHHENVKKIEAVYYGSEKDYFTKSYNIARIFDNNKLMREKLIPLKNTRMIPEITD